MLDRLVLAATELRWVCGEPRDMADPAIAVAAVAGGRREASAAS